ncbi:MAG: trehalase family glycosidase [Actinomycetota bacterium]|nr:trehalase family glycosidase [Actinomycetota bacterium]
MSAALHDGIRGFASDPPRTGGQTLVLGTTFVVCGPDGDIDAERESECAGAQGLFVRDARVLSRWRLRIDGHPLQPLGGFTTEPSTGVFVARAQVRDGRFEPTLLVERRRRVGAGMVEEVVLRNYGPEPAGVSIAIDLGADFADLLSVKLGRPRSPHTVEVHAEHESWSARVRAGAVEREVSVCAPGAVTAADAIAFRVVVPSAGTWRTTLVVSDGGVRANRLHQGHRSSRNGSAPAAGSALTSGARRTSFRSDSPALTATLLRSQQDLAALTLFDPEDDRDAVVAAGAPWFLALFGRDALITTSMTMALRPDLAVGTLRALARHQGRRTDLLSEEEPGRILHELRSGFDTSSAPGGVDRYYGSIDATPLFVMVVAQLARYGASPEVVDELLPAVDMALGWVDAHGDRDGDGFVEYRRTTDRGLRNQGWKDSGDGVSFADGSLAEPPIALVEVQGYVYGAFAARSELARARGDSECARYWSARAETLKRRINEAFWLPDKGYYAIALDGEKRPVDALASNMGHLLWSGAADDDKAAVVAERLLSPEMFSGYGIRTLATTMGAFNPASYHNGSVWAHDTAISVAGLARYGFVRHAQRVAVGLVEAASYFSGRLPELFCGFDKTALPAPVPYPASCAPQAWASAAPVSLVVSLLRLDPDLPRKTLQLAPGLPPEWGAVQLTMTLGAVDFAVQVRADGRCSVTGADGLRVVGGAVVSRV